MSTVPSRALSHWKGWVQEPSMFKIRSKVRFSRRRVESIPITVNFRQEKYTVRSHSHDKFGHDGRIGWVQKTPELKMVKFVFSYFLPYAPSLPFPPFLSLPFPTLSLPFSRLFLHPLPFRPFFYPISFPSLTVLCLNFDK